MEQWGVMGSIPQEVQFLIEKMDLKLDSCIAGKKFYRGFRKNKQVIVVETGIGKVNAAMTAQLLISNYQISKVIFAGTAGGLLPSVKIGDVVVAQEVLQHDVSGAGKEYASKVIEGRHIFSLNHEITQWAKGNLNLKKLNNNSYPSLHFGRVLTGDRVIVRKEKVEHLIQRYNGLCVEMEGGAVAQVCHANEVPLLLIRIISDYANETSKKDFNLNVIEVCINLTKLILQVVDYYDEN